MGNYIFQCYRCSFTVYQGNALLSLCENYEADKSDVFFHGSVKLGCILEETIGWQVNSTNEMRTTRQASTKLQNLQKSRRHDRAKIVARLQSRLS